jgi:light-regulated signal transduction histidine kinase (bacteriophytochrome)
MRSIATIETTPLQRWGGTFFLVMITTVVQHILWPLIDPAPFLLFYPTIIVCSLYFDGPLAVVLSGFSIQYIFTKPRFVFEVEWPQDYVRMAVFLASGALIVILAKALKRAQKEILVDQRMLQTANQQLNRQNQELENMNHELSHFASVAAHDLKAPLQSIALSSELIVEELGPKMMVEVKQYFNFIIAATRKMNRLIEGLLEFAKAGKRIEEFQDVDLEPLINVTLENLKSQIHETGAKIKMQGLPKVRGDELQLMLLFQNLISNSIKYREPSRPPEIQLTTDQNEKYWIIRVEDNGLGFDPKDKNKVFEPFQRLHPDQPQEGSGIGLATVKRAVDAHCGEIWVDPRPGAGTVFYVKLPKDQVARECQIKHSMKQ